MKTICRRILLKELSGSDYIPEANSIENLINELNNQDFGGATLGRCFMQICDLRLFFIKENRQKNISYSNNDWDVFLKHNPLFRGIKIPSKLKEVLLIEKLL